MTGAPKRQAEPRTSSSSGQRPRRGGGEASAVLSLLPSPTKTTSTPSERSGLHASRPISRMLFFCVRFDPMGKLECVNCASLHSKGGGRGRKATESEEGELSLSPAHDSDASLPSRFRACSGEIQSWLFFSSSDALARVRTYTEREKRERSEKRDRKKAARPATKRAVSF